MPLAEPNPSSTPLAAWERREYEQLRAMADKLSKDSALKELRDENQRLMAEIVGYRRALLAHHELSTLSDEVIQEYDFRDCPVCRRARDRD
jgi:cell division protein ZapA (FtsZ GTPase activity inhibitor)